MLDLVADKSGSYLLQQMYLLPILFCYKNKCTREDAQKEGFNIADWLQR